MDQPADQVIGVRSLGPDGEKGAADDLTSWTMGRDVTDLARGKRWTPAVAQVPVTEPKQPDRKQPDRKQPDRKQPDRKQPDRKQPGSKGPTSTGIVDLDGDGIPDSR